MIYHGIVPSTLLDKLRLLSSIKLQYTSQQKTIEVFQFHPNLFQRYLVKCYRINKTNVNMNAFYWTFPAIIYMFQEDSWKMSIGVPIKVLHEAEGHIVTCETNTGEVYRGKLIEAEDNMNCQVSPS